MQRTEATIDPHDLARAGDEYRRLRRRYWQFFLGGVASFAVFGLPLIAFGNAMHRVLVGILGVLTGVLFLVGWAGALATWFALINWRCPRCGKRFILSWTSSWPTDGCKHCGLDLGGQAAA